VERPITCSYCRKYLYHHRTDGAVKGSVDLRASNIDIAESQRLQHITCRCGWTDGDLSILHPDDIAALETHSELLRSLEKGDAPAAVNAYSDLKRLLGDTSPVVNAYSGLEQVKRMLG
jgi:hypothetical protein